MNKQLLLLYTVFFFAVATVMAGCAKEAASFAASADAGKGGSLACFTIARDHLYVVSNHYLYAYSLADGAAPRQVYTSPMNFDIETIYPYGKYLFLGTRTGMYIYSIEAPSAPKLLGEARHARSCDPVVANDSIAFVTLKGNAACGPATSGLYVHNIKDISKPQLLKTVALPDPVGLGLQDNILYVCCGTEGLKVFNVSKPGEPALLGTKKDGNYVDVIPYSGVLICFVQDGIILYDISTPESPVLVKKIDS